MRRLGRRQIQVEQPPAAADTGAEDENRAETAEVAEVPARRRRQLPFSVEWALLFSILALMIVGAGLILMKLGALPETIVTWWPLVIVTPALLWLLVTVIRRNPSGLLSSTASLGIGISLLLATKTGTPIGSTLVGVLFITIGTGILLRGLLFGPQPIN